MFLEFKIYQIKISVKFFILRFTQTLFFGFFHRELHLKHISVTENPLHDIRLTLNPVMALPMPSPKPPITPVYHPLRTITINPPPFVFVIEPLPFVPLIEWLDRVFPRFHFERQDSLALPFPLEKIPLVFIAHKIN
jgi:hypothetical protein